MGDADVSRAAMLADTVNANGSNDHDPAFTQPPSPTAAGPTHTSEPGGEEPSATPRPIPGMRLRDPDRYQVLGEHGRGGLGRVSRAHDLELGRDIAIKELISRGSLREVRFLREALITARLEHPGIVPVYEAGRWPDGTPFYAMKLVAGRSLRDLIAERPAAELRIGLLHHVIAVADAIAYAHGRNIIHRDLKPSNVIVGDFGETIVIDWGLAKDLSAAEESTVAGGPFRTTADDELTSAGSILGTPAYMAPEQRRGDHVDQRADVFAIGAMLWELCAPQRLPPPAPVDRRRMLARAGIDPDLATIVLKALAPDPAGRYRDAGTLAADLKAFKAGARIAARSYSPLATLRHWTRRHRNFALSIATATVLAAAGTALYIRNIAVERDRAEDSSNRLTLEHAELLLRSDPTAAHELLATYHGSDTQRLSMLRAEAEGLGVSLLRARLHTLAILFSEVLEDGSLVTAGGDGTVTKTANGQTRTIGRGVALRMVIGYAAARHLLAYPCESETLCILDIETERLLPSPSVESLNPVALAFSHDGTRLAAISADGHTAVWRVTGDGPPALELRDQRDGGEAITFLDDDIIATLASGRVQLTRLGASASTAELAVSGANHLSASEAIHTLAVSTTSGTLVVIGARSPEIVRQETVCKELITSVVLLPKRQVIAYACKDGTVGTWDLQQSEPVALDNIAGGAETMITSVDERYLLVGANTGRLLVYDFVTQLWSAYLGHMARITSLRPPSMQSAVVVSGDTTGNVRTWSPPVPIARVAIRTADEMYAAIALPHNGPIVALGAGSTIPWSAFDGSSGQLAGHEPSRFAIAASTTRPQFAAYGVGRDDAIELWSFDPRSRTRVLRTQHGAVMSAAFEADGNHLVIGGREGSVVRWSTDDNRLRALGTIPEPVSLVRAIPGTAASLIGGASGQLWIAGEAGLRPLGSEASSLVTAVGSPDSRWLAVGTSQGVVRLYDVATGAVTPIFKTGSWVEYLAFSADSTELAIATEREVVGMVVPAAPADDVHEAPTRRYELPLSTRMIAFSPDNQWLAMTCERGDIWFYGRTDHRWVYVSTGTGKISFGRFSDDSTHFIASDAGGRALVVDMRTRTFQKESP